jgi:hypothetical protein
MSRQGARARLEENPFYVLGLPPDCARAEMEREGQKLLGMLELGLSAAAEYAHPLGRARRTPELVRQAMAELRDPVRRLAHELWAQLPAAPSPAPTAAAAGPPAEDPGCADAAAPSGSTLAPFTQALWVLGWSHSRR